MEIAYLTGGDFVRKSVDKCKEFAMRIKDLSGLVLYSCTTISEHCNTYIDLPISDFRVANNSIRSSSKVSKADEQSSCIKVC